MKTKTNQFLILIVCFFLIATTTGVVAFPMESGRIGEEKKNPSFTPQAATEQKRRASEDSEIEEDDNENWERRDDSHLAEEKKNFAEPILTIDAIRAALEEAPEVSRFVVRKDSGENLLLVPEEADPAKPGAVRSENIKTVGAFKTAIQSTYGNVELEDIFAINPMASLREAPALSSEKIKTALARIALSESIGKIEDQPVSLQQKEADSVQPGAASSENIDPVVMAFKAALEALKSHYPAVELTDLFEIDSMVTLREFPALSAEKIRTAFERIVHQKKNQDDFAISETLRTALEEGVKNEYSAAAESVKEFSNPLLRSEKNKFKDKEKKELLSQEVLQKLHVYNQKFQTWASEAITKRLANATEIEQAFKVYVANLIAPLNFSTERDEAVFWTGYDKEKIRNQDTAISYAKEENKKTIEMTWDGKLLDELGMYREGSPILDVNEEGFPITGKSKLGDLLFDAASKKFAENALGNVTAVIYKPETPQQKAAYEKSAYYRIEEPILLAKKAKGEIRLRREEVPVDITLPELKKFIKENKILEDLYQAQQQQKEFLSKKDKKITGIIEEKIAMLEKLQELYKAVSEQKKGNNELVGDWLQSCTAKEREIEAQESLINMLLNGPSNTHQPVSKEKEEKKKISLLHNIAKKWELIAIEKTKEDSETSKLYEESVKQLKQLEELHNTVDEKEYQFREQKAEALAKQAACYARRKKEETKNPSTATFWSNAGDATAVGVEKIEALLDSMSKGDELAKNLHERIVVIWDGKDGIADNYTKAAEEASNNNPKAAELYQKAAEAQKQQVDALGQGDEVVAEHQAKLAKAFRGAAKCYGKAREEKYNNNQQENKASEFYATTGAVREEQVEALAQGNQVEAEKKGKIAIALQKAAECHSQANKELSNNNPQAAEAYSKAGAAREQQAEALDQGKNSQATLQRKVAEALGGKIGAGWCYRKEAEEKSNNNIRTAEHYKEAGIAREKEAQALQDPKQKDIVEVLGGENGAAQCYIKAAEEESKNNLDATKLAKLLCEAGAARRTQAAALAKGKEDQVDKQKEIAEALIGEGGAVWCYLKEAEEVSKNNLDTAALYRKAGMVREKQKEYLLPYGSWKIAEALGEEYGKAWCYIKAAEEKSKNNSPAAELYCKAAEERQNQVEALEKIKDIDTSEEMSCRDKKEAKKPYEDLVGTLAGELGGNGTIMCYIKAAEKKSAGNDEIAELYYQIGERKAQHRIAEALSSEYGAIWCYTQTKELEKLETQGNAKAAAELYRQAEAAREAQALALYKDDKLQAELQAQIAVVLGGTYKTYGAGWCYRQAYGEEARAEADEKSANKKKSEKKREELTASSKKKRQAAELYRQAGVARKAQALALYKDDKVQAELQAQIAVALGGIYGAGWCYHEAYEEEAKAEADKYEKTKAAKLYCQAGVARKAQTEALQIILESILESEAEIKKNFLKIKQQKKNPAMLEEDSDLSSDESDVVSSAIAVECCKAVDPYCKAVDLYIKAACTVWGKYADHAEGLAKSAKECKEKGDEAVKAFKRKMLERKPASKK